MELNEVFTEYGNIYSSILNRIYPAKNSTGFPERNLSVNFSKAYERVAASHGELAYSWFEFQFGPRNSFHADAVILNDTTSELFIVEAKRFSNPATKIRQVGKDIDRIYDFVEEIKAENKKGIIRIDIGSMSSIYGVILSDVWKENSVKEEILRDFENNCFIEHHISEMNNVNPIKDEKYDVRRFDIKAVSNYNLTSLWWKL